MNQSLAVQKPNIVLITPHDSGRFFGFCGARGVATPQIDGLAADATHLTNFHAAGPICSPSRASLLTGMYPQNHGVRGIPFMDAQYELQCPEKTFSHICQDNGYETALVGIQHVTAFPEKLGFDHRIATENPTAPGPVLADAASRFIAERSGSSKPFYLEIGTFETHTPYDWGERPVADPTDLQSLPDILDADDSSRQKMGQFADALSVLDRTVGRIIQQLKDSGLYDNTLIIFNVDHGAELPRAKWFLYDAGLHVPVLIKWPKGFEAPATYDGLLHSIDLLPTILDALGMEHDPRDGRSFLQEIRRSEPGRDVVFGSFIKEDFSARSESHKLILSFVPRPAVNGWFALNCRKEYAVGLEPAVQLFDLRKDPQERNNLAKDPACQSALHDLAKQLKTHLESFNDPVLQGSEPHWQYTKALSVLETATPVT